MSDTKDSNQTPNQVTVYIDNVPYQVNTDNNLLAGVLSQKLNLPYFCWHPSMGSVGACRQCAVTQYHDENDSRGRIVMACTTPVTDGMRIGLNDGSSTHFREQVIGAMMTNHPHDCPVCAEGGECHLQDMTVMTGHNQRDYQGSKRTFTNQYLGDFVGHEMNRCITCYRCTRFYNDYAGGKDFGVFGSKNQVYFGRANDGALESEFSGNLVEVCPTGVFTNKIFSAHYTRKWDLQSAPSVCAHCSVGCNTSIGERYGTVRRVVNRYNKAINGYFLCDRGRFGIGFVNGEKRIRHAKGISQQSPTHLSELDVAKALSHHRGKTFIGIGSGRASLEANFYLQHLVGHENFSAGYSNIQMSLASVHREILSNTLSENESTNESTNESVNNLINRPLSLEQIEQSDFVFIIGEDITQTAPRMALSVRQALRNVSKEKAAGIGIPSWQDSAVRTIGGKQLSPLYSLQCHHTKLDDVCEDLVWQSVEEMTDFVNQLTALLSENIHNTQGQLETLSSEGFTPAQYRFIKGFIPALLTAKAPVIITGCSLQSALLLTAIANLTSVISNGQLVIVPEQSNSVGLMSLIDEETLSTEQVISKALAEKTNIDGLILLEQEWLSLNPQQHDLLRASALTLIVLDHTKSELTQIANIVMPVSAVSEGDGHFVNYQGMCQRYYQVHAPVLPIQDSWRWLSLIESTIFTSVSESNNRGVNLVKLNTLSALNRYFNQLEANWQISDLAFARANNVESPAARQTPRASGRTSQMANVSVHETKSTQSHDDAFRFSMEGSKANKTADMPFTWAPSWNSNQSISQFQQEVAGELMIATPNINLNMAFNSALSKRWSCTNIISKPSKKIESQEGDEFIFVQQPSLYWSDWQSSHNPEFSLKHEHNTLHVSKAWAEQKGWPNGGVVQVVFEGGSENSVEGTIEGTIEGKVEGNKDKLLSNALVDISYVAVLVLEKHLPAHLAYGQFWNISPALNNISIKIFEADEQSFTLYQHMLLTKKQQAKTDIAQTLKRMKITDQTIPIRLMSGGLDDV